MPDEERRVSLFVPGMQKGGTTSFFAYLSEHPGFSAPSHKEIHCFDDETSAWPPTDYNGLHSYFAAGDANRIRFDATPSYASWPPALGRIKAYNDAARLIFLFRDPFDRAWSHWRMEYSRGNEKLPFAEAIRREGRRLADLGALSPRRRIFNYVERGFYAAQVRRALQYFPREQCLFLQSEDLRANPALTLSHVADFLGVARFTDIRFKQKHASTATVPAPPTPADRAFVAAALHGDLLEFAQLTGLNIAAWPTAREAK